jgi:hypothetical protein
VSDLITPTDISRLAANESIISAVLKWAAANGRRLSKADLERMGAGVDAMVDENARLTKEREELASNMAVMTLQIENQACRFKTTVDLFQARIKRLEEADVELAKNMMAEAAQFNECAKNHGDKNRGAQAVADRAAEMLVRFAAQAKEAKP